MDKPGYRILLGHHDETLFGAWSTFLKTFLERFRVELKQVSGLNELWNEVRNQSYDLHILFLDNILVPSTSSLENVRTSVLDCIATLKAHRKAPVIVCSAFDDTTLKERVGFAAGRGMGSGFWNLSLRSG